MPKKVEETTDAANGEKKTSCARGCLVLLGVLILLIGAGVYLFTIAGKGTVEVLEEYHEELSPLLPEEYGDDVFGFFSEVLKGVISGEIEPDSALELSFALFRSLYDGVLTPDEIRSILELLSEVGGERL
jgi:hypothetical protein